jgi:nondiscriminating aspartyl-tRNA synthetase
MKRTLISETVNLINNKVRVAGWVSSIRSHGKLVFVDLRDRSGIIQVVAKSDLAKELKDEYVVEVEGVVNERPQNMVNPSIFTGKIELFAEKIKILAKSESLPFDIKTLNLSLPNLLDWRPLSLKNDRVRAIFKVQEKIVEGFRTALKKMDFVEFQAPAIVPSNAEGGAAVFSIDYYGKKAYLAQSPQLYKQIMLNCFERVFCINRAFRAEPSFTTRHLSEYTSLDVEMGFIDSWEDLMDTCQVILKTIFSFVQDSCKEELKIFNSEVPKIEKDLPRLKLKEAQKIIFKRTGRDVTNELDLSPEDEKEICQFAKEEYGSDLIFITHYPTVKRPFYTFPDPEDPEYTLSFDILFRGLEVTTGGQRINDYNRLIENLKKWGNNPKNFEFYLQAFKYGMPPEGGFAFGLERLTKQILGLENVREATIFVRDVERIDERLTKEEPKENKKNK